ncbi:MAG: hypothetical protein KC484_05840 [Colwelliaceae bacterium]|nr:hypothetical protein [Colwelliaceae bacterium]
MELKKIALIAGITISAASNASQTEAERSLSIELTKAVVEINSNAPQKLDEDTRLDSAATFRNFIIYNNTMTNYTAEQLDVKLLDPIIEENVIGNLCSNKALAGLIEGGVTMVYRYHGKNGQFITELSKDMSTCKKI